MLEIVVQLHRVYKHKTFLRSWCQSRRFNGIFHYNAEPMCQKRGFSNEIHDRFFFNHVVSGISIKHKRLDFWYKKFKLLTYLDLNRIINCQVMTRCQMLIIFVKNKTRESWKGYDTQRLSSTLKPHLSFMGQPWRLKPQRRSSELPKFTEGESVARLMKEPRIPHSQPCCSLKSPQTPLL